MPLIAKVRGLSDHMWTFLLATFLLLGLSAGSANAVPRVLIKVGDTTAANAQLNTVISVFMQNFNPPGSDPGDTIAGYKIYLQLDNPDIMKFQGDSGTAIDTTYWDCTSFSGPNCIESTLTTPSGSWDFRHIDTNDILIGNYDTVGTLSAGWQYVTSRSLAGSGYDILLVGLADDPFVSGTHPGIAPQTSNTPLLKLLADIKNLPDSLTGDDRKVNIVIQTSFVSNFGLSKPNGSSVGISYQHYLDSNFYVCNQWAGSNCIGGWQQTSTPPFDSLAVIADSFPFIDTSIVLLDNGSVTVLPGPSYVCGDINNNATHTVNVLDLNYLVAYFFASGPPPPAPIQRANVNCSMVSGNPTINVLDLNYMVSYFFAGGPIPCAACQ